MTNINTKEYKVIGLMSGTSLDGLDIAYCRFVIDQSTWTYDLIHAETIPYSEEWKEKLVQLETSDAMSFQQANIDYGFYLGQRVSDFIVKNNIKADFVSSHGHTIFHQPEKKLTVQIGAGSAIASKCKLPVVCDFRSLDVALSGQGAPLVPIGDKLLFGEYDICLNLGGFANVSYEFNNQRIAYDICPVNIVLNEICSRIGKPYDDHGELARAGLQSYYLLNEINQLGHYKQILNTPKSLGKEWVLKNVYPLIDLYELSESDVLCTYCEHVAIQVAKQLNNLPNGKILVTGGGTYNTYLIARMKALCKHQFIIPEKTTIEFKEALIFAFLGVLRLRNEVNCLKSVTGSLMDNCGGSVYAFL